MQRSMKVYFLETTVLQFYYEEQNFHDSWPQLAMTTVLLVLPEREPTPSISVTTSIPSTTLPNTTCFPSKWAVFAVQMKNWDPFVFGPAFAIDRIPKRKKSIQERVNRDYTV